jgi:hypothetical protein
MLYEAEKGDISILVAGDAMITKRMSPFREECREDKKGKNIKGWKKGEKK